MNRKQIVFLEPWATPMIAKMAKLLRKRNYYTISIRILGVPDSDGFSRESFDKIIYFNLDAHKINLRNLPRIILTLGKKSGQVLKAVTSINKLNPYVIFTRAQPSWPCALARAMFKKTPIIYFPYDIRSQGYISEKEMKEIGINNFEIKAEKYCFKHADGIIHKGADNELECLNENIFGRNFKICKLHLHFPPYCVKEFIVPINKNKLSKKDKEYHLVTTESTSSLKPIDYLVTYGNELAKQKIHLHAYIKANINSEREVTNALKASYAKVTNPKYFHLHSPLGAKEIIKEISKYDYGLVLINPKIKDFSKIQAYKFSTGNKIATYFEAGIPFFCSEGLDYTLKLLKKYGLELKYNSNILKTLKKVNYSTMENRVIKARKDFLMEKHIPELERFIEKVVEVRRRKNE